MRQKYFSQWASQKNKTTLSSKPCEQKSWDGVVLKRRENKGSGLVFWVSRFQMCTYFYICCTDLYARWRLTVFCFPDATTSSELRPYAFLILPQKNFIYFILFYFGEGMERKQGEIWLELVKKKLYPLCLLKMYINRFHFAPFVRV